MACQSTGPVSQMPRRIHALMQDTDHCHHLFADQKIDHVAFDRLPSIARTNVVTCRSGQRRLRERFETRRQTVDVTFSLTDAPTLGGITPDVFQILYRRRRQSKFSHA